MGVFVGSDSYTREYVDNLVKYWNSQLCILSTVAESQPQAAYLAFVSGFKNKLSYFMTTIPDINKLLIPIEDTIRNRFIAAIKEDVYAMRKSVSYYLYQLDIAD